MPSPAQGLFKTVSFAKQPGTGPGTPYTGSTASPNNAQYLRRKTSVFQATRDTSTVDEIVSHRQDTGIVYGQKKTQGKIDGALSAGTWSKLLAGALMQNFGTTAPFTIGTDCTAAATPPQIVDASGGILAAGIKAGDIGRFTGFTTTGTPNNARNFLVGAVTASNMTGTFLDAIPGGSSGVTAKTETGSVVFTVVGKKALVPLTAHTNDYFTFEEWYSDKSKSELFPDCKPNKIDIQVPAAGAATISVDIMGTGTRTLGVAQVHTSPDAETTTGVLQAVMGAVLANGSVVANVTSASFTIDRGLSPIGASIGNAAAPDFNVGRIRVSGTFTAMFNDTTIQAIYDAAAALSLVLVVAADTAATADFMAFTFGRIKLQGDAPDDGEKVVSRTYPWTAEINGAGGTALAWDKTIMTVQDSQA